MTDESGKITKKDALWLGAAAILISWVDNVLANPSNHSNYTTSTSPAWSDPFPSNSEVPNNGSRTNEWTIVSDATCNHASWIVNWHFSSNPTVSMNSETIDFTKSHASHWSHWSHWSHASY